jgi:hypothetical protein
MDRSWGPDSLSTMDQSHGDDTGSPEASRESIPGHNFSPRLYEKVEQVTMVLTSGGTWWRSGRIRSSVKRGGGGE